MSSSEYSTPKGKKIEIDFWNARGVCVLYSDLKSVYVGKTETGDAKFGSRLRNHLTDRFAGPVGYVVLVFDIHNRGNRKTGLQAR
jgi:hypothetical protein